MESLGYYWNFFVDVEKREFFRFLGLMRNLSPTDGWLVSYWPLLFLFALEFVFPWRKEQRKLRFGIWLDVFYVYFNVLLMWALFGRAVVETTILAFNHVLYASFGITNLVAIKLTNMQMWARLVLMLLFVDFLSYLGHWVLHRVNFLWQFHKIHHSSTELDVWNSQRFHLGEKIYFPLFNYLPVALIGFPPGEVFVGLMFISLFSTFTHANVKIPLGPLKYFLNNPQMHIWHHAKSVDPRRNVNYGDALSVWDYLFGTAYVPAERPGLELGFEGVEEFPTTFWGQLVYPFREILRSIGRRLAGLAGAASV